MNNSDMAELTAATSDKLNAVCRVGASRLREVATTLDMAQEYARATPQFKADCKLVVAWLRAEADFQAACAAGLAALEAQEKEQADNEKEG